MKNLIIELRDVHVVREASILKNISWTVRAGEQWVVLGANGSGKTSLLNTVTGYVWPSQGEIFVLGQQFGKSDWRQLRWRIGLVSASLAQRVEPNEIPLEIVATGKDAQINFWGRLSSRDRRRAQDILKRVECTAIARRPWKYLSQGERQRVLIGRALMADLAVLILDEPCAGLDPAARQKFLAFLERFIGDTNVPVILVTHHIEEIVPAMTHVLALKAGRVAASGPKAQVLASRVLDRVFDAKTRIYKKGKQYFLEVKTHGNAIA